MITGASAPDSVWAQPETEAASSNAPSGSSASREEERDVGPEAQGDGNVEQGEPRFAMMASDRVRTEARTVVKRGWLMRRWGRWLAGKSGL